MWRGGFGNVSCTSAGLCVATEDLSWQLSRDSDGLAGFLAQRLVHRRRVSLGRGLPGPDQLVVAEGGVQCLGRHWCLVAAGSDTGMFTGLVLDGRLQPLQVVPGVRLHGLYPDLTMLACASRAFCVETSDNVGTPYVLVGTAPSAR